MPYTKKFDGGKCKRCGAWTCRIVGCWCYRCYLYITDLDRPNRRYIDPDREERIALYRDRAEREEPLFGD